MKPIEVSQHLRDHAILGVKNVNVLDDRYKRYIFVYG